MNHLADIQMYLKILVEASDMYCLILKSPPGWAKSTTIAEGLKKLHAKHEMIGSYTTPLAFYNALATNRTKTIVLDDCAGLFENDLSMSILKAATESPRMIAWNSSSDLVSVDRFTFKGKLILITNSLPEKNHVEALKSRSIVFEMNFSRDEIREMLLEASRDRKYYPNQKSAQQAVKFLIEKLDERDFTKFNLRTLKLAVRMQQAEPKRWKDALAKTLPKFTPQELVKTLAATKKPVREQFAEFARITEGSRRMFFYYRQELGLSSEKKSEAGKKGKRRAS